MRGAKEISIISQDDKLNIIVACEVACLFLHNIEWISSYATHFWVEDKGCHAKHKGWALTNLLNLPLK